MSTNATHNPDQAPLRVGAVSFFNALPLTFGLLDHEGVELTLKPPAQLPEALDDGRLDVALVPSIDYQRSRKPWSILPVGAIGSHGTVLTVRVLAQRPIEDVQTLAADTDSHTSITLARIIWQLRFGRELDITPLTDAPKNHDAVLLIGDKVLSQTGNWAHQLDLGQAWREETAVPFVYAFWATPAPPQEHLLPLLRQSRRLGMVSLEEIVRDHAKQHGFSKKLGRHYLTENICFDWGRPQLQGLARFYELAHQFSLIPENRPLNFAAPCPATT